VHVVIHEPNPEHWRLGPGEVERSRLVVSEEDGTMWLWAHPRLLGHPSPIVWLFSPVDDAAHPGDLWGIDGRGNLVVVESKLATRDEEDPFVEFLEFAEPSGRPQLDADHLLDHWLQLFEEEDEWLERPARTLPSRPMPGVFPYAEQRAVARRWPDLYDRARAYLADEYIDTVIDYLARRRAISQPYYYALVVATGRHGAFHGFNAERTRRQLHSRARRAVRAVGVFADVTARGDLAIVSSDLVAV